MSSKIIVCTHKTYPMPDDGLYMPLQMGAALHEPIINGASIKLDDSVVTGAYIFRDNEGENISEKNDTYRELTGLYWAWKNLDADIIGLVHYRKYFTEKNKAFIHRYGYMRSILSEAELDALFLEHDIVVPQRRRYYVESLYSHYGRMYDASHLDMVRNIIAEKHPEYMPYVNRVYGRTWGYMFNMMIMKRKDVEEYCPWLFGILSDMEFRMSEDDKSQPVPAERISEILFNVWLEKKKQTGSYIKEVRLMLYS